jgi:ABC-type glycerol-3-phosphate transport system substrate-binding protein
MCLAGPWSVDTLRIQFPDLNYGVALIPSNEKGVPGKFGLISMGWVVRKDVTSAEKEAIFTVLKEIINPDVNIWFTDSLPVAANFPQNGVNPSTGRVINFVDHPKYQVWLEQLKHTYPSALLHPVGPRMAVEVNTAIEKIILGEDLDKVLAETDKIINDMLKSY